MSCPNINIISNSEYIGNSLNTINNNFSFLKNGICDNENQLNGILLLLQNLDTTLIQLSSQTSQGIAKSWVKFSGNLDSNNIISLTNSDRFLFNSEGISSVFRKGIGDYRVFFSIPFSSLNYIFSISNKETLLASKYYYARVYKIEKEYIDIKVQAPDNSLTDPEFVSLIIFI